MIRDNLVTDAIAKCSILEAARDIAGQVPDDWAPYVVYFLKELEHAIPEIYAIDVTLHLVQMAINTRLETDNWPEVTP